ncbi:MAG: acylphosphatase [Alphaproteobacteria bacterium]|nr:acylphosphatase [Alphaproteobacteria bacterium]
MVAIKATISGRVQGVWYRGWTVENAQVLGLDGWVRNRKDGTVEACFSGAEALIQEMLSRCRSGPIAARVTSVSEEPAEKLPPAGFVQLPTA